VTTAIPAAVTASSQVGGREDHQVVPIEVIIIGPQWAALDDLWCIVKGIDAWAADARAIPQVIGHLFEQGFGDVRGHAPARSLVGGHRAQLTVIRFTAQRTDAHVDRFA
jgi:hypothetical protein